MTDRLTKMTKREAWIEKRAGELLASGWRNPALAAKRAASEWRAQSPQRKAAVERNAAMKAARDERMAALPASDPLARR